MSWFKKKLYYNYLASLSNVSDLNKLKWLSNFVLTTLTK